MPGTKEERDPENVRLGRNIKRAINRSGRYMGHVANAIGIKPSLLSAYVNGAVNIKVVTLVALAKELGCDVGDLIDGPGSCDSQYDPGVSALFQCQITDPDHEGDCHAEFADGKHEGVITWRKK